MVSRRVTPRRGITTPRRPLRSNPGKPHPGCCRAMGQHRTWGRVEDGHHGFLSRQCRRTHERQRLRSPRLQHPRVETVSYRVGRHTRRPKLAARNRTVLSGRQLPDHTVDIHPATMRHPPDEVKGVVPPSPFSRVFPALWRGKHARKREGVSRRRRGCALPPGREPWRRHPSRSPPGPPRHLRRSPRPVRRRRCPPRR